MHAVLVSGIGGVDALWKPYRNWFRQVGFTTTTLESRYWNFGPIQARAKDIARHVDNLKFPPVLVGHSVGGLAIRYYMAHYYPQTQTPVAGVVTIGSPLYGAPLAKLLPFSSAACQMRPDSGFLSKLEAYQDPEIPWLSIRCSFDPFVPGENSLLVADDAIHSEAPTTHWGALLSERVFDEVHDFSMACLTGEIDELVEEAADEDD